PPHFFSPAAHAPSRVRWVRGPPPRFSRSRGFLRRKTLDHREHLLEQSSNLVRRQPLDALTVVGDLAAHRAQPGRQLAQTLLARLALLEPGEQGARLLERLLDSRQPLLLDVQTGLECLQSRTHLGHAASRLAVLRALARFQL